MVEVVKRVGVQVLFEEVAAVSSSMSIVDSKHVALLDALLNETLEPLLSVK